MKQFHFNAYGLHFSAEFAVSVFSEIEPGPAQVVIRREKIRRDQYVMKKGFLIREMTPSGFLFCVKDVAAFLIVNGETILVDPDTQEQEAWEMLLSGPVMAILLQQRGFLTLSGSAFLYDDRAILMLGPSGVGKSSLAMALDKKGCSFLTDDICAISFSEEGKPILHCGSGQVALWQDSMEALGLPEDASTAARQNLPKFRVSVKETPAEQVYPIGHVYILKVGPLKKRALNIQTLDFLGAIKFLGLNLCGRNSLVDMGLENESFKMIHKMAKHVGCARLLRRESNMETEIVSTYLESILKS